MFQQLDISGSHPDIFHTTDFPNLSSFKILPQQAAQEEELVNHVSGLMQTMHVSACALLPMLQLCAVFQRPGLLQQRYGNNMLVDIHLKGFSTKKISKPKLVLIGLHMIHVGNWFRSSRPAVASVL